MARKPPARRPRRTRGTPRAERTPPSSRRAAAPKTAPAAGSSGPRRPPRPRPAEGPRRGRPRAPGRVFPVEVEPGSLEQTLARVREQLTHWVKKGRYTKVRFKLRGRPLLPDIPVAAFLAAEALTFWWAGLLRALLVNVGARSLLEVELVSEADQEIARGKAALLGGDLARATAAFERALAMDRDSAAAHLNLGIAHKLRGDLEGARASLQRAEQLDPDGPSGEEARRLLDQLGGEPAGGARNEAD